MKSLSLLLMMASENMQNKRNEGINEKSLLQHHAKWPTFNLNPTFGEKIRHSHFLFWRKTRKRKRIGTRPQKLNNREKKNSKSVSVLIADLILETWWWIAERWSALAQQRPKTVKSRFAIGSMERIKNISHLSPIRCRSSHIQRDFRSKIFTPESLVSSMRSAIMYRQWLAFPFRQFNGSDAARCEGDDTLTDWPGEYRGVWIIFAADI